MEIPTPFHVKIEPKNVKGSILLSVVCKDFNDASQIEAVARAFRKACAGNARHARSVAVNPGNVQIGTISLAEFEDAIDGVKDNGVPITDSRRQELKDLAKTRSQEAKIISVSGSTLVSR